MVVFTVFCGGFLQNITPPRIPSNKRGQIQPFLGFSEFGLVSRRAKEPHSFRMCYTSRTPLGILYAGSIRLGSALAKGWNECPGPGACF